MWVIYLLISSRKDRCREDARFGVGSGCRKDKAREEIYAEMKVRGRENEKFRFGVGGGCRKDKL